MERAARPLRRELALQPRSGQLRSVSGIRRRIWPYIVSTSVPIASVRPLAFTKGAHHRARPPGRRTRPPGSAPALTRYGSNAATTRTSSPRMPTGSWAEPPEVSLVATQKCPPFRRSLRSCRRFTSWCSMAEGRGRSTRPIAPGWPAASNSPPRRDRKAVRAQTREYGDRREVPMVRRRAGSSAIADTLLWSCRSCAKQKSTPCRWRCRLAWRPASAAVEQPCQPRAAAQRAGCATTSRRCG